MASTTRQNYEQLSYGAQTGLSMQTGKACETIGDAAATRTLLNRESGAVGLLDVASGVTYTLPPPVIGMEFEFVTTVSVTSNSHKIVTDAATTFIVGAVQMLIAASATTLGAAFNGTTHRSITMNGTTTGGLQGTQVKLKAISSTVWAITGLVVGSGSIATPAATS